MSDYDHREAFCLMKYRSDDGTEEEIFWNSRDGVTPFVVESRSGKEMTHVDWNHDVRVLIYRPKPGERIFVDAEPDMLRDSARAYVNEWWDRGMSETMAPMDKKATVEHFLKSWTEPGSPHVVTVGPDGSWPGKKIRIP